MTAKLTEKSAAQIARTFTTSSGKSASKNTELESPVFSILLFVFRVEP
jgi:hypothetical protein